MTLGESKDEENTSKKQKRGANYTEKKKPKTSLTASLANPGRRINLKKKAPHWCSLMLHKHQAIFNPRPLFTNLRRVTCTETTCTNETYCKSKTRSYVTGRKPERFG